MHLFELGESLGEVRTERTFRCRNKSSTLVGVLIPFKFLIAVDIDFFRNCGMNLKTHFTKPLIMRKISLQIYILFLKLHNLFICNFLHSQATIVVTLTSLFTYGSMRGFEGEWSETLIAASAAIADKYDIGDLEGDINTVAAAVCSFNLVLTHFFVPQHIQITKFFI